MSHFSDIEWIFFDLDETLWDHKAASDRALNELARLYNIPDVPRLCETFSKVNYELWMELYAGRITFDQLREYRFDIIKERLGLQGICETEEIASRYIDLYLARPSFYDGAVEVLEAASNSHRLAILTNAPHRTQDVKLAHLPPELRDAFEFVHTSDDCDALKPAPHFFESALLRAGSPSPAVVLMVGDSLTDDLSRPSQWGWRTVWISHGREIREDVHPTWTVTSLKDLRTLFEMPEHTPSSTGYAS